MIAVISTQAMEYIYHNILGNKLLENPSERSLREVLRYNSWIGPNREN